MNSVQVEGLTHESVVLQV